MEDAGSTDTGGDESDELSHEALAHEDSQEEAGYTPTPILPTTTDEPQITK